MGRTMAVSMAAMMSVLVIVFALVSCCESVLYQIRQPVSSVFTSPYATDVAFTSAVADRVVAFIGTLDPNVPACASVPHCDLRVARVRLVADGDFLDDVFHVVLSRVCCATLPLCLSTPKRCKPRIGSS